LFKKIEFFRDFKYFSSFKFLPKIKTLHGSFLRDPESFLGKNAIFETFRFNTHAFPESGKPFFASKMSNLDPPHVFTSPYIQKIEK
jgi:hypothetical protein